MKNLILGIILLTIILYQILNLHHIIEPMGKTKRKNIYGRPLKKCRKKHTRKNRGSWDSDGYCSELGGGVHQICFDVNDKTKNFSNATYQSGWSRDRNNHNHCMCLGAWALYKARQNKNQIPKTYDELLCDAIPETVFNPEYVNTWNTWNNHELPNQIKAGVKSLYNQCYRQAKTQKEKTYLTKKYNHLMQSL